MRASRRQMMAVVSDAARSPAIRGATSVGGLSPRRNRVAGEL